MRAGGHKRNSSIESLKRLQQNNPSVRILRKCKEDRILECLPNTLSLTMQKSNRPNQFYNRLNTQILQLVSPHANNCNTHLHLCPTPYQHTNTLLSTSAWGRIKAWGENVTASPGHSHNLHGDPYLILTFTSPRSLVSLPPKSPTHYCRNWFKATWLRSAQKIENKG